MTFQKMVNEEIREMVPPAGQKSPAAAPRFAYASNAPGDEPLIKIRPSSPALSFGLKEVWADRELLYFLVWRDLKVRYRQAVLGASWVVLQPLLAALVFTVFIGRLAHVPSNGLPYTLFAYAGLLAWTFFSNGVSTGSYSLVSNSYIITKVYFPRLIIPAAVVAVRLIDFLVASAVLFVLMFFYGVGPGWGILMLPVLTAQLALLTLAVGLWFAVMNVRYRDVGTLLPVLIQLWMFASPIIYPASLVPEKWRILYSLNPMVGTVEGMRAALFGLSFDWNSMIVSAMTTALLVAYFVYDFGRREDDLAEAL